MAENWLTLGLKTHVEEISPKIRSSIFVPQIPHIPPSISMAMNVALRPARAAVARALTTVGGEGLPIASPLTPATALALVTHDNINAAREIIFAPARDVQYPVWYNDETRQRISTAAGRFAMRPEVQQMAVQDLLQSDISPPNPLLQDEEPPIRENEQVPHEQATRENVGSSDLKGGHEAFLVAAAGFLIVGGAVVIGVCGGPTATATVIVSKLGSIWSGIVSTFKIIAAWGSGAGTGAAPTGTTAAASGAGAAGTAATGTCTAGSSAGAGTAAANAAAAFSSTGAGTAAASAAAGAGTAAAGTATGGAAGAAASAPAAVGGFWSTVLWYILPGKVHRRHFG